MDKTTDIEDRGPHKFLNYQMKRITYLCLDRASGNLKKNVEEKIL